ncbi:hypothetical protein GOBAR_AA06586 [Gossypium barbadense]|uniref:RNase H type-1 domain-containing protein n=1 Tax=Gossypium barbadense TaxID=3634 RepID=A0A2P5YEG6_GOSBA|nr:hypothetical protein GOBAR_AA06586 [Gossypium barbadense]
MHTDLTEPSRFMKNSIRRDIEQARKLSARNGSSILELCAIEQQLVLKEPQVIAWSKSSAGGVKMNTDSARSLHLDGVTTRGVVQDHQGHWLARFMTRGMGGCMMGWYLHGKWGLGELSLN